MEKEKMTMTVKEMGRELGISLPKAYEITNVKGFPILTVGRRKIIPVAAFKKWLDAQISEVESCEKKK